MSTNEVDLIKRIAGRDEQALATLYESYFRRLTRFILRVTRRPELVVEVINDVFLVVWENSAQFRGESLVSTWIMGIAYRRALKTLAKDSRQRELADHEAPTVNQPTVERDLDLDVYLTQISAEQRAVIELTYFFGHSYKEIAEILDCPENTVKTRMFHARRALRALMEV